MAFWSDTQVADPKRQHRWIVDISAPEVSQYISYVCKSVAKPKITIGEAEHKFINHTFYYPGGVTYDPVTITLVDPANPHSSQALYDLLQISGYRLPDTIQETSVNNSDVSTISKRKGVGALLGCSVSQMDGNGKEIEKITFENAWIKSVDFGGDLNYENEGLVELSLEIRFDFFKLETFAPSGIEPRNS